mmetsp:Transcript_23046/g.23270  ORF Transcript_23046/g.23270 Transcript_23046/m.23270 type:complete len:80 (-) Transcript_23046:417-656(-)
MFIEWRTATRSLVEYLQDDVLTQGDIVQSIRVAYEEYNTKISREREGDIMREREKEQLIRENADHSISFEEREREKEKR